MLSSEPNGYRPGMTRLRLFRDVLPTLATPLFDTWSVARYWLRRDSKGLGGNGLFPGLAALVAFLHSGRSVSTSTESEF